MPKPWIRRHWIKLLIGGIVGLILVATMFAFGLFFLVAGLMKNSDAYKMAMERIRNNPAISGAVGTPLKESLWSPNGSINVELDSGAADFSISFYGPKGKGVAAVEARKSSGKWEMQKLEIQLEGHAERLDLLHQPEQQFAH